MSPRHNKVFAAALLCGAIGFAGAALAQGVGGAAGTQPATEHNNANVSASGNASEQAPSFLAEVKSKSTPAKGLSKTATMRVDREERQITAELNRASAASNGSASASSQASIPGSTVTQ